MEISINVREWMESPAFSTPTRLGVFVYLAALASPKEDLTFTLRPVDLSDRLNTTRSKIADAITKLGSLGVINRAKSVDKRGVWTIDMSPSAHLLHGDWSMAVPACVPIREMMLAWDEAFKTATAAEYLRARNDFWRERKDWISLYESLGDKVYSALEQFFADKKNAQWGYRFTVFFRSATQLANAHKRSSWRY